MSPRRVMLGVGIDAYEHLRPLKRAVADVQDVTRRFAESGFEVLTLLDASRAAIADALGDPTLAGLDQPGSVLVVLWAGHAARNQSGALRLFAVDNRETDPDLKLITVDQLAQAVANTRARQILLILDTCYSGAG